ncbi:MAG: ferritin family protein [Clostridia bacterium]|nr:ferritin family protein [Clostridia bacterium]
MWKIFKGAEIAEFAVRIEQNGYTFYDKAAAHIQNPAARELLDFLKEEELKHEKLFRDLMGTLTPANLRETYEGEYEEYLKALVDNHVFGAVGSAEKALSRLADEIDVINTAIGFEKDTILFFRELLDLVSEKDRQVVEQLIEEEKSHLRKLAIIKGELCR